MGTNVPNKCEYCDQLRKETEPVEVYEVVVGYQEYRYLPCPINYCPVCGCKLEKE